MNNTNQTSGTDELADNYLAAWNEADALKRQELLARVWDAEGTYRDPIMQGQGISQIAQLIEGAQKQFAGMRLERTGKAEQVGNCVRFSWHLVPTGEASDSRQPVMGGTDFCVLDDAGYLQSVTGFIDFMPTSAA